MRRFPDPFLARSLSLAFLTTLAVLAAFFHGAVRAGFLTYRLHVRRDGLRPDRYRSQRFERERDHGPRDGSEPNLHTGRGPARMTDVRAGATACLSRQPTTIRRRNSEPEQLEIFRRHRDGGAESQTLVYGIWRAPSP